MKSFIDYAFNEEYRKVEQLGDKLAKISKIIDWNALLQRQLDSKDLEVNKGVLQDATFITADPRHAKADKPRGDDAMTRRSKDGTWANKDKKSYFGYKLIAHSF